MPKLLHEQLSPQYINEWFNDSLFVVDGALHRLLSVDRSDTEKNKYIIRTHTFNLSAKTPKWAAGRLPLECLKDFTTFKYPKLGYRQFQQGDIGNIVVQASSIRAAQRGLRFNTLRWAPLPAYMAVLGHGLEPFEDINEARRAKEIFSPTFTPFSVGISQLLKNETLGFAVSEDLAVGVACVDDGSEGYNVYFRGRVVGTVDNSGKLTLTNKILQRESIRKKLFK